MLLRVGAGHVTAMNGRGSIAGNIDTDTIARLSTLPTTLMLRP